MFSTSSRLSLLLLAGLAAGADRRVIIVGLDGCSPDGIQKAKAPNLERMRRQGAFTFHARGVMPTVSSPNWASMIMGAGPEQHGITSNDWQPEKFDFPATDRSSHGRFPTIFGLLRGQRPKSVIGIFHDWEGFGRLVEPEVADAKEHLKGPAATMERAIAFWKQRSPQLLFIHLDHVDHAGHEKGHGTPEYYESVAEADRLIGTLLDAVGDARPLILVTADHGGAGKKHGGNTLAEIEIPWIATGPGVVAGRELRASVNTFDTAATIAWYLGLKMPQSWIGRPVREAFGK